MSYVSLVFSVLLALVFNIHVKAQAQLKPNILFVIADDWSYGHAGFYGDKVIRTPNMDRIAKEGASFTNAFCAASSCTPSRGAILTGRYPHQLEAGASLWGTLPKKYPNWTEILEKQGYYAGLTGKGWGPGNFAAGGYSQNPAGKQYKDFETFFAGKPTGQPFLYWLGTADPHRPYDAGAGAAFGMNADQLEVPGWLPNSPVVRNDILDYYYEIERIDKRIGEMLEILRKAGQLENTLVIVTSDNGMPFPRGKATMYDSGTKIPLLMSWKGHIPPATEINDFVNLIDLAPTFVELTGHTVPPEMTGISIWPLLKGEKVAERSMVFLERERHANVRIGDLGYPVRGVRTEKFLYLHNYAPERWPGGDPELYHSVGHYGDIDDSPTKDFIIDNKDRPGIAPFFKRAFSKRNTDELFDLEKDPHQLENVAASKKYKKVLQELKTQLHAWQIKTGDPRVQDPKNVPFDKYPYYGPPVKGAPSKYKLTAEPPTR